MPASNSGFMQSELYAEVKAFVSGETEAFLFCLRNGGNSILMEKEEIEIKIDTRQIQELRALTGAGVMDCKRALEESLGDFARARALLVEKAEKTAQKKAGRMSPLAAWLMGLSPGAGKMFKYATSRGTRSRSDG